MTLCTGPALPLFALIWPLMLGVLCTLPALRPNALRLLPFAPVPALILSVIGFGDTTASPVLLMGVVLVGGAEAMLLLAMTAALWTAVGTFAQGMSHGPNGAVFAGFWCLTLAGNLGVFLAADVVTFYVAFVAVSLAAYVLVVHDRTEKALHAGAGLHHPGRSRQSLPAFCLYDRRRCRKQAADRGYPAGAGRRAAGRPGHRAVAGGIRVEGRDDPASPVAAAGPSGRAAGGLGRSVGGDGKGRSHRADPVSAARRGVGRADGAGRVRRFLRRRSTG